MLSGCGYFDGYAIQDYLKKVNEIQHSSDSMLLNLDQDLNSLGADLNKVEETVERLKTERDEVESARMELESLEVPQAAEPLEAHLLELYAQGAAILGDLAATGSYRLSIEPLITQYEESSKSFSEKVKAASDKKTLSSCLQEYQNSVISIGEKVHSFEPPVLSSHSHTLFIYNLNTLQTGLAETIAGLENEDAGILEAASKKMAEVDGESKELHQQITAGREADINDYNSRIQKMSELLNQIGQDQVELHERYDRK
jgi:DNA repair exonuclease SbcCD ATPase subunit